VYHDTGWLAAFHAGLQLVGLVFIVRSVRAIDALELAGIREATLVTSPAGKQQPTESLQIRGPYHVVRHPLYLGWMLFVFGAAHMTTDRLAFAAISSFYLVVAIPWEERSLGRTFGAEYERYKRQVKWRVIPYVY
jgi:protein-S-isoprenylcysteine O-methyltransferase Ste14